MTNLIPSSGVGARVTHEPTAPSLNLAPAIGLLTRAIRDHLSPSNAQSFIRYERERRRIVVETKDLLNTVFKDKTFVQTVAGSSPFVANMILPRFGGNARVGGRILPGSEQALAERVDQLVAVINQAIDKAISQDDLKALAGPLQTAIAKMARNFRCKTPSTGRHAHLVPIAFSSPSTSSDRNTAHHVARMYACLETIDGELSTNGVLKAIENYMRTDLSDVLSPEDVAAIIHTLRTRAEISKTEAHDSVSRFVRFLEDQALSRARLQVAMHIMDSVAKRSTEPLLKTYVKRIRDCFECFAQPNKDPLEVDVSTAFGQRNNFRFGDMLKQAGFYNCLPVWAQWATQTFEVCADPMAGTSAVREVSYRFKVNGTNPHTGERAFVSRLVGHHERLQLFAASDGTLPIRRTLAELVFLWIVIPAHADDSETIDVTAKANELAARAQKDPLATFTALVEELNARRNVVQTIATALRKTIREKAKHVLEDIETMRIRVSVSKSVIDCNALLAYTDSTDVLMRSQAIDDHVEWLSHLSVSDDSNPKNLYLNSLLSFLVHVRIQDRTLATTGDIQRHRMAHDLNIDTIPVRLIPYAVGSSDVMPGTEGILDGGHGIDILYAPRHLGRKEDHSKNQDKAITEQARAAGIAMLTTLIYVTLALLTQRVTAALSRECSLLLIRLGTEGRSQSEADDARNHGSIMYAISHAVEMALAHDIMVKRQGFDLSREDEQAKYRHRGTLAALIGGHPVIFVPHGRPSRIAVITYATRPCDSHSDQTTNTQYLWMARTYEVEPLDDQRARIRVARMRTHIIGTHEDIVDAHPVMSEIAWLAERGHTHVILLAHHFGTTHLGRAHERKSPHMRRTFLDRAHELFPAICFYPLHRDVFPATRLRRQQNESAFEVLTFADHERLYDQHARSILRGVLPIYTLATLRIVGNEDERPQSGFCTYFYDIDHRMADWSWQEARRAEILGTGGDTGVRAAIIDALRAVHFLESEKEPDSENRMLAVLDPYDWTNPDTRAKAGEIEIMSRRRNGDVYLNLTAVLTTIGDVMRRPNNTTLIPPNEVQNASA